MHRHLAPAYPVTLYYDGSCQLCSGEMRNLRARDTAGRLAFVDCSPEGFAGGPAPAGHAGFDEAPGLTPAELLARYDAACARSRAATDAAAGLDVTSALPDPHTGAPFSLRWALLHLLEETARHNGHIDLLREQVDGLVGE